MESVGDVGGDGGEQRQPPRDQARPEPNELAMQSHPAASGEEEEEEEEEEENSTQATDSVQDNATLLPFDFSNLHLTQDMEEEQPMPEEAGEEELLILDPEHPDVLRQQAALTRDLREHLRMIDLELREKQELEERDAKQKVELGVDVFRIQEQLARLHCRLEELHQNKAEAEAEHRHILEQSEEVKSLYSKMKSQHKKTKATVSQQQAEIDKLSQQLVFMQGASEDVQSNAKVMNNTRRKAGTEKSKTEEQKLKQDLYVKRLTEELDRLNQQEAMYDVQARAQSEVTQTTKQALSEAEMEMESLVMLRKQLLQQWNSTLLSMRRQDEALNTKQEALRSKQHQVMLKTREIEAFSKSITEEQEKNETLTLQLNWYQMDGTTCRKQIAQKQAHYEALQAQYSTCIRCLRETESTLARLTKETDSLQAEMNEQRRQLEKERALRLELEDMIMNHMQQKLSHTKAAEYSQHLTGKTAALKKEKIAQLWQLENKVVAVGLESSELSQHLESLALTQDALDAEMTKYNKSLTTTQAQISASMAQTEQKQGIITNYNRKISQIAANTGNEDFSPLQIKIEGMKTQIEELEANITSDQQLWMKRQGILVGLMKEIEANSKSLLKLHTEHTVMQQRNIQLKSQIEAEERQLMELQKNSRMLRGDLVKLNTLLSRKGQYSQALEQENILMEKEYLNRLKEAEQESVELQMRYEKIQEERERLTNTLMEAEQQIMLWERKTLLVKETRSVVDSEEGKGEIQKMKAEIHRMEVRLSKLMKQKEQLMKESVAVVERRFNVIHRRAAAVNSSGKEVTKGKLSRQSDLLKRKIRDTQKELTECERVIRELQESQVSLAGGITQQKQQLVEVCGTSSTLDHTIVNLQESKDRNLIHLVALQSRNKKLQCVCEGSYKASTTSESITAAMHSEMKRVHAVSTIVRRVCQEFPQYQEPLHRLALALEVRIQALDAEASGLH